DGDDAVEQETIAQVVVDEECLGDGSGIGQASGFDENVIEAVPAFHQAAEDADEVAANGAADAPVVHFKDFFLGADDQLVIDADLAEFILDDGNALAMLGRQDVIEQRGLASAEKAGQNGDGNASAGNGHGQKPSGCIRESVLAGGDGVNQPWK